MVNMLDSNEQTPFQPNFQQELLNCSDGINVSVITTVEKADQAKLWDIIQPGFEDLNRRSFEKQDMTFEEFQHDMESSGVLKYIAKDGNNELVGCLTVHLGLEDINWLDTKLLENSQHQLDPTATPYYIGTIVVPIKLRGSRIAAHLIQGSFLHFESESQRTSKNSLCFFDCAEANYPNLANFIQRCGQPTSEFKGVPIKVSEIDTNYWINNGENANPEKYKSDELPQDPTSYSIIDAQHLYSIELIH